MHLQARLLAEGCGAAGIDACVNDAFFDTIALECPAAPTTLMHAARATPASTCAGSTRDRLGIALDETSDAALIAPRCSVAGRRGRAHPRSPAVDGDAPSASRPACGARTPFLDQPVFHRYRTETEMLRYLKRLEERTSRSTAA